MKKILLFTVIVMFQAITAIAADNPNNDQVRQRNFNATQKYYEELTSGTVQNGAELNLIMTMLPKGGDLHSHYSGTLYS
ncbi:MAG: hypothetical protein WCL71_10655, partial [Deltaproteobacteria bacterium]